MAACVDVPRVRQGICALTTEPCLDGTNAGAEYPYIRTAWRPPVIGYLSKLLRFGLCVACAVSLVACGGKPDPATMKVAYFLVHPDAIQTQQNWCGKQGNPRMIYGCQSGAIADFLVQRKLAGWVTKPEPMPGRDAAYFSAVRKVPASRQYADAQNEFDWCLAQYFVKSHQIPDPAMLSFFNVTPDFSEVSKSCRAIYEARRG